MVDGEVECYFVCVRDPGSSWPVSSQGKGLLPKMLAPGIMSMGSGLQTVGQGLDTRAGPEALFTQAQGPLQMAQNYRVFGLTPHPLPGTAPAVWGFTYIPSLPAMWQACPGIRFLPFSLTLSCP